MSEKSGKDEKKKEANKPDNAIFDKTHTLGEAIKLAKEHNGSKKFKQTIDLCVTTKQIDFKKQESKIKETIYFKNNTGIKKIVYVIGKNISINAKDTADKVFNESEFTKLEKDKKQIKIFSKSYDYLRIAKSMGRILGPLGKMPSPLPPTADPKPTIKKLRNSVTVISTQNNAIQIALGKEDTEESVIKENYHTIMSMLKNKFPHGSQNIKTIYLKTTMGKKIKVESKI